MVANMTTEIEFSLDIMNVLWYYICEVINMKQQPKRKDLVRITVSIPEYIRNWVKEESQKNNESLSLTLSRLLETLHDLKKNLSLG